MSRIDLLHAGRMKHPAYRKEYDALEEQFAPAAEEETRQRITFAPPHASGTK